MREQNPERIIRRFTNAFRAYAVSQTRRCSTRRLVRCSARVEALELFSVTAGTARLVLATSPVPALAGARAFAGSRQFGAATTGIRLTVVLARWARLRRFGKWFPRFLSKGFGGSDQKRQTLATRARVA